MTRISTNYQDCPNHFYMLFFIHIVFWRKKKQKQWSTNRISQRYALCEESLHLENKNILRIFLGLKLKKLRTSEGLLQFWCSYKKKRELWNEAQTWKQKLFKKSVKFSGNITSCYPSKRAKYDKQNNGFSLAENVRKRFIFACIFTCLLKCYSNGIRIVLQSNSLEENVT